MKKIVISTGVFGFVFLAFIFLVAALGEEDTNTINDSINTYNGTSLEDFIENAKYEFKDYSGVVGGDKYREWYTGNIDNEPWCATFVSYIAAKTGILDTVIPKFQSCDAGVKWFSENDEYFNTTAYDGYYDEPSTGDIIFFSQVHDKNDSTHVGIVISYEDGLITTIEGNSGNRIKMKSYRTDSRYIIGYAVPDYSGLVLID